LARTVILGATLLFIAVFAALTVAVVVYSGPSVLTLVSLLVLALVASGVIGAVRHPPPEE